MASLRKHFSIKSKKTSAIYNNFLTKLSQFADREVNDSLKKITIPIKREITFEDLPGIVYLHTLLHGSQEYKKFRHAVIDEAQDYGVFNVEWVEVPGRYATGVPSENYLFAEIHINNDIFDAYTDFNVRQGIIAHEFGHAWGLGHNPENPNSIMYNWDNRNVYTIQQVDQNAFNALYP